MGNQILNQYSLDSSGFAEGGSYLKWRCGTAFHYSRPTEPVTIFFFDKKQALGMCKADQESLFDILRQDARHLQKLRHPFILPLVEPLYEDVASLSFVTQHVKKTLAGYLDEHFSSLQQPHREFPLEAKSGFYDICEALSFLHNDAKLAHWNISPTSIFLSPHFHWYLGCFGYAQRQDSVEMVPLGKISTHFQRVSPRIPNTFPLHPCLAYSAPELIRGTPEDSYACDIYSLGLVLLEMMSPTKIVLFNILEKDEGGGDPAQCTTPSSRLESLSCCYEFSNLVTKMTHPDPKCRPTIADVMNSPFFNDSSLRVLRFLENFVEKSDSQKVDFLKELTTLLSSPTGSLVENVELIRCRVVIPLLDFLEDSHITVPLLTIIFSLFPKYVDQKTFDKYVWIKLKALIQSPKILAQAVLLIVQHLSYLFKFSESNPEMKMDLIFFIVKCLSLQFGEIQVKTTQMLYESLRFIDRLTLMTRILPVLLETIAYPDTLENVQLESLKFLHHIINELDGTTINNLVVKQLAKVPYNTTHPLVAISCSSMLAKLIPLIGYKKGLHQIVPLLILFLNHHNLNSAQFETILDLVLQSIHAFAKQRRLELQSSQTVYQKNFSFDEKLKEEETQPLTQSSFPDMLDMSSETLSSCFLNERTTQHHPLSNLLDEDLPQPHMAVYSPPQKMNPYCSPTEVDTSPDDPHGLHILYNSMKNAT